MSVSFRIVLSSASLTVSDDLFMSGSWERRIDAEGVAADIRTAQPGIRTRVIRGDANPRDAIADMEARF